MNIQDFEKYIVFIEKNFRNENIKQYMFPNKYGASVIFLPNNQFEVAVITIYGEDKIVIVKDTPITNDVLKCYSEEEVVQVIIKIQALEDINKK